MPGKALRNDRTSPCAYVRRKSFELRSSNGGCTRLAFGVRSSHFELLRAGIMNEPSGNGERRCELKLRHHRVLRHDSQRSAKYK